MTHDPMDFDDPFVEPALVLSGPDPTGTVDVTATGDIVVRRGHVSDSLWHDVTRACEPCAQMASSSVMLLPTDALAVVRQVAPAPTWRWTSAARWAARQADVIATSLTAALAIPAATEPGGTPAQADLDLLAAELADNGFTRTLRNHQLALLPRIIGAGNSANFSVPGAGKTTVAWATWTLQSVRGACDRMLVVAPHAAFESWTIDALECLADPPRIDVRPDIIANDASVVIVNYERLADPQFATSLHQWAARGRLVLFFDEAHRAKAGEESLRGSASAAVARIAEYRHALTGTPMTQDRSDLIAVMDLVWPGHGEQLVDGNLAGQLRRAYARVTKSRLGLPDLDIRVEQVDLDPAHRRLYDAMVGELSGFDPATSSLEQLGQAILRLVACTTVPQPVLGRTLTGIGTGLPPATLTDLTGDPDQSIRPAKILRLAQLVDDLSSRNRKTLVWSSFVGNVHAAAAAVAHHQPAVITGAVPPHDPMAPTDRERELARFRTDSNCRVLIATPQTLGEGVSLHHTCVDQVHLDRSFAAGTWLQSIDRTHRLGMNSDSAPTCTVLVAADTVDARVHQLLSDKVAALSDALDDPDLAPVADPAMLTVDVEQLLIDGGFDLVGILPELIHRWNATTGLSA